MSAFELVAALPLEVEGFSLEELSSATSSGFTAQRTVVRLHGSGDEGLGEDVVYDPIDQFRFQRMKNPPKLAGNWTLGGFCEHVASLDLFPVEPVKGRVSRLYRRWAFESAALDLALRQAGVALHEALGRDPQPVRFVVSLRLGDPPSLAGIEQRLGNYPSLRFKTDPTADWDDALMAALSELRVIDTLDMKGMDTGSFVDRAGDPELYGRVVEAFPAVWIEDPDLTVPECDAILEPHRDRISWDGCIHSTDDIEARPFPPRMVNIKPSRFGGIEALFDCYEYCESRGIGMYGGGQYELGPGRGQAQYLASLFHADAPNDIAPSGFNAPEPPPGLEQSPLAPAPAPAGFRFGGR